MNKGIIVGVVAVVVLGGGFLLMNKKSTTNVSQATTTNTTTSTSTTASDKTAAATITYSNNGFSPSKTTVKTGDTVAITNNSSSSLQFDSNPHPAHSDDADLNVGTVGKGQTVTFTVTKMGTFGFHNHFNAGDTGSITVQ